MQGKIDTRVRGAWETVSAKTLTIKGENFLIPPVYRKYPMP